MAAAPADDLFGLSDPVKFRWQKTADFPFAILRLSFVIAASRSSGDDK
jgi:hypothetical protein